MSWIYLPGKDYFAEMEYFNEIILLNIRIFIKDIIILEGEGK